MQQSLQSVVFIIFSYHQYYIIQLYIITSWSTPPKVRWCYKNIVHERFFFLSFHTLPCSSSLRK